MKVCNQSEGLLLKETKKPNPFTLESDQVVISPYNLNTVHHLIDR